MYWLLYLMHKLTNLLFSKHKAIGVDVDRCLFILASIYWFVFAPRYFHCILYLFIPDWVLFEKRSEEYVDQELLT